MKRIIPHVIAFLCGICMTVIAARAQEFNKEQGYRLEIGDGLACYEETQRHLPCLELWI